MGSTPWGDAESLRTRRLRPGRGASREAVAANQRERLFVAMVALADERGYRALRVDDLRATAGVSRGAFYAQFAGKDDCLVAVVDALVEMVSEAMTAAAEGEPAPRARARAGLDALIGAVTEQPAAARLWLVEAYGAGEAAIEAAERGVAGWRRLVDDATSEPADGAPDLPPEVLHGIAGGLRRMLATRLRAQREDELARLAPDLLAWMLSYAPPAVPLSVPRIRGSAPAADVAAGHYRPRDQVERLLLGTCAAAATKGWAATTIADVVSHASTSVRTFYEHFDGKEEAYAAALDFVGVHAYASALSAARRAPDWPRSVRAGIDALCGFLADEPAMARAGVVEVYAAGDPALRRHDAAIESFTRALVPGLELAPAVPRVALEALGGAIDSLLHRAIRAGGGPRVRAVAPAATFLALAPFVGSDAAAELANDTGTRRRRP